jgi:predicted ATP-grasp superfamily ATP-dependent carboligase
VVRPLLDRPFRAYMLTDRNEAERRLAEPLNAGVPVLLSQYIPGGDGDVEEAIQVRLANGSYAVSFGVRKLRQAPPGFGETALGESSELPEATELARKVLDAAGFVGVAGVEVKRDARTGERWFLEVNVRIPNQWGLGDACGVDATRRLVAVLAGRPTTEQPPLRPGVRFVATEKDIPLLLRSMRPEPLRRWPRLAAGHLRPYLRAGERTVLSLRDPMPAAAWVRDWGGQRFGRE